MDETVLTEIMKRTCLPEQHVFLGKKDWMAKSLQPEELEMLKTVPDCRGLGEIEFEGRKFAAYRVGWYIRFVDCELHDQ